MKAKLVTLIMLSLLTVTTAQAETVTLTSEVEGTFGSAFSKSDAKQGIQKYAEREVISLCEEKGGIAVSRARATFGRCERLTYIIYCEAAAQIKCMFR